MKYRFLEEDETIQAGDQIIGTNETDWFEVHGNIGKVVGSGRVGHFRRPMPFEQPEAILVTLSPQVRVVVEGRGLSWEELWDSAAKAAIEKILADPRQYIHIENVDWANTKKDVECPEVNEKIPAEQQYRMLEVGEIVEEGDEWLIDGEWHECDMIGVNVANILVDVRRPLPRYRPFREGDMVCEGDQWYLNGRWTDFSEAHWGHELSNGQAARKLIK